MDSSVRKFLEEVASRLGERAALQVEPARGAEERIELIPRNEAAAAVLVEYSPRNEDQELYITVAGDSEPGDLDWLHDVVEAAVAGRVRLIEGLGRHRLEIELAPNDVRSSTSYDALGCLLLPLPWRRWCRIRQFEPYT
jgi:hypothetical protein